MLLLAVPFSLNLLLFVLNLIPFPPLEGFSVFPILFGEDAAHRYKGVLRAQPMLSLMSRVLAWNLSPGPRSAVQS